ncbi:TVP38/TMEM64 family protein [Paraglaciecola arctica]|uniref:TVP38/TMEM64 family membrane protein n=1 Tax=Paraglaciecola arctica BSs20135 TaxID=493475 RepID=K6Y1P3_9ALTE|nr:VTT domain-containing protein [Paraglaciecola arctica]GAC17806.1 hypothetical protein GARC_0825 [Paraglaciecola arctica BSs20135]
MKSLIKVTLVIAAIFASTFVLAKMFGVLSIEQIQTWLEQAHQMSDVLLVMAVIILLFADLFVAVPTLTICLLSGYFLGFGLGAISALVGVMLAGSCGYWISHFYGEHFLKRLLKHEQQRQQLKATFEEHGFVMILLSRAMPIIPEVSACLAGMTLMPFLRFMLAWSMVSVPYVFIAAYSGSISSLSDPKPAIITAVGLTTFFAISWSVFKRKINRADRAMQISKTNK